MIMITISWLTIGLFKLIISSWLSCGSMSFSKNWSISSKLSNIWVILFAGLPYYPNNGCSISSESSYFISDIISGFYFLCTLVLLNLLSILLIFFVKKQLFVSLIFSTVFLFLILLICFLFSFFCFFWVYFTLCFLVSWARNLKYWFANFPYFSHKHLMLYPIDIPWCLFISCFFFPCSCCLFWLALWSINICKCVAYFKVLGEVPLVFTLLISNLIVPWSESTLYIISWPRI